mgnify:CR=1 FL=1
MAKLSSSNGKKANVPKLRFPEFSEEWKASNIGEISTYIKGAPLSKTDISETGTPFILYGELYTTYKEVATEIKRKTNCIVDKKYLSKIGDVVIPTSGETPEEIATATCVMTPNVILAGDLNIFRINDIDGRFFSYVINHKVNKDISRIAQGKSIVHIKGEEISKIQIKYPSDKEQQKILSFIELLSLKIEKQGQLIDKLKKYKRGSLSALFPKKGEITPQYRFAGFTKPWEQRKLGDVFTERTERANGDEELLSVTIGNGVIRQVDSDKRNIASEDKSNYKIVHKGDVPYNSMRMWQGAVGNSEYDGIVSPAYTVLVPSKEANGKFFMELFKKESTLKIFQRWSQGLTSDTWNLKYPVLSTIEISIPRIEEQKRISDYFANLDRLITLHQHKYDTLLSLKNAILQQMFI